MLAWFLSASHIHSIPFLMFIFRLSEDRKHGLMVSLACFWCKYVMGSSAILNFTDILVFLFPGSSPCAR